MPAEHPRIAQELTIFWAEWDPANYLQELVNEYEKETGVKVTVETTPWSDFQTKAFTEFNAKGSAYDMVVGDSPVARRRFRSRPLRRPHRLLQQAQADRDHGAGHGEILRRISGRIPASTGRSRPKATRSAGPTARTGSKTRRKWKRSRRSTATTSPRRRTGRQLRDIAEFFHRPDEKRYGVAIYTDNSYDALAMGVENAHLLLRRRAWRLRRPTRSTASSTPSRTSKALEAYKELYSFTPPGWAKTFFVENNQAITENLAAMSMNYFAFFPALINEASNPNAKNTGFFANPPGPSGDQFAALGGQGISIVSYSENQEEAFKFLEWFIKDETQKKWAELGGYTAQRQGAGIAGIPERHAVQQGLLRDHVQGEGLLGDAGICRTADRR